MDPITIAAIGLGLAGTGVNIIGGSKKKKQARRQARLEREIRRREQERLLKETGEQKKDTEHEFEGPFGKRREMQEGVYDRGLGDSSISNDYRTELEYQKSRRMGALDRKEEAIRQGIIDSSKLYDIQQEMAKTDYWLGITNSLLSGGMWAAGQYAAGSRQPGQV